MQGSPSRMKKNATCAAELSIPITILWFYIGGAASVLKRYRHCRQLEEKIGIGASENRAEIRNNCPALGLYIYIFLAYHIYFEITRGKIKYARKSILCNCDRGENCFNRLNCFAPCFILVSDSVGIVSNLFWGFCLCICLICW